MKFEDCLATKPKTFKKGDMYNCNSYIRIITKKGFLNVCCKTYEISHSQPNIAIRDNLGGALIDNGPTKYYIENFEDWDMFVRKAEKP